MAKPTETQVHQDAALTSIARAFGQDEYIARRILPSAAVEKESDVIYLFDRSRFRQANAGPVAGDAPTNQVDYGLSTTKYFADEYRLMQFVPDRVIDNADAVLDPLAAAAENVTERLLITEERALASYMNATTHFTGRNVALSGSNQWHQFGESQYGKVFGGSGSGLSDPLKDIEDARAAVHDAIGKDPNVFACSRAVWQSLKNHPDVLYGLFGSNARGALTREQFAALIEVEEVLIAGALYNAAVEGASDNMSQIYGKHAWLVYRAPRPSPRTMSWGYTLIPRNGQRITERWRVNDPPGVMVRVRDKRAQKVITPEAAYMIGNAVA